MKKEMLINVLQPEEIRIAIVEDGVLEELYVERASHESYVGNIYKGRIVNIEPSIQAAFVDFGVGRNGFLHVSDVEPAYYRHLPGYGDDNENGQRAGRDRGGRGSPARERGGRRGRGRGRRSPPEADEAPLPQEQFEEKAADSPPTEAPSEPSDAAADVASGPSAAPTAVAGSETSDNGNVPDAPPLDDTGTDEAQSDPTDAELDDDAVSAVSQEPMRDPQRRGRRRRGNHRRAK
ncbi:MAG: S1 RNA-binding domain-containing protein, partial [Gemmataceae bacterium]|nr:S1 RNA-binding domain-containing protein [Gemmataceae bacterium]